MDWVSDCCTGARASDRTAPSQLERAADRPLWCAGSQLVCDWARDAAGRIGGGYGPGRTLAGPT